LNLAIDNLSNLIDPDQISLILLLLKVMCIHASKCAAKSLSVLVYATLTREWSTRWNFTYGSSTTDLAAVRCRDPFWRIFCLLKMEENCLRDCIVYQGCIVCLPALLHCSLHCSDILCCIMQMSRSNIQDAFSCLFICYVCIQGCINLPKGLITCFQGV